MGLEVSANADAKHIVSHTQNIFRGINVTQLFVHLDFIEHGHSANYSSQYLGTGDNLLFSNGSSSYHHQNNFTYGNSYGGKHSDQSGHGHSHDHGSGHGHGHGHSH